MIFLLPEDAGIRKLSCPGLPEESGELMENGMNLCRFL